MWKRVAVLVVVALLPVSALAHTKLFYRMSCRSDYRKVEVTSTPEPMVTAKLTLVPTEVPTDIPTPTPTEVPTDIPSLTPSVEKMDTEDTEDPLDQITIPSDVDDQVDIATL